MQIFKHELARRRSDGMLTLANVCWLCNTRPQFVFQFGCMVMKTDLSCASGRESDFVCHDRAAK